MGEDVEIPFKPAGFFFMGMTACKLTISAAALGYVAALAISTGFAAHGRVIVSDTVT